MLGETPYSCNLCGKTFSFQQSYHKHMLYHTDEKPHTCTSCGRAFKELSTLQNHERIHSGERPFVCESCGKSFRQRVSYLVHRRIHTGVLPYSCSACHRNFRYKVTQRTHKCTGLKLDTETEAVTVVETGVGAGEAGVGAGEETNTPNTVGTHSAVPPLSSEIKQNLARLRAAQGRRHFSSRIQTILSRSRGRASTTTSSNSSELPQSELQRLSLAETNQLGVWPDATVGFSSPGQPDTGLLSSFPGPGQEECDGLLGYCETTPYWQADPRQTNP